MGYYPESLDNTAFHDSSTGESMYFHRAPSTGEVVKSSTPNNFTMYNWSLFHPLAGTGHPEDPLYTRDDRRELARRAVSIDEGTFKSVSRTAKTGGGASILLSPKEQKEKRISAVLDTVANSSIPAQMLEEMGSKSLIERPIQRIEVKPMTHSRNRGGSYAHKKIELFDNPIVGSMPEGQKTVSNVAVENPDVGNWLKTLNDPASFIAQGLANHDSLYRLMREPHVHEAFKAHNAEHTQNVGFEQLSSAERASQAQWDENDRQGVQQMRSRPTASTTRIDKASEAYRRGIANHIQSLPLFPGVGKETEDYAVKNYKVTYYERRAAQEGENYSRSEGIGYDEEGKSVFGSPFVSERKTVSVHMRFPKVSDDGESDEFYEQLIPMSRQTGLHISGGVRTVTHEIGHALTPRVDTPGWNYASHGDSKVSPILEGTADGFEDRFGGAARKRAEAGALGNATPLDPTSSEQSYGVKNWKTDESKAAYLAARVHAGSSDYAHREIPHPKDFGIQTNFSYADFNYDYKETERAQREARLRGQMLVVGHLVHHNPAVRPALEAAGLGHIAKEAHHAYLRKTTDAARRPTTYQEPLF